jgi:serine/threonine protein kinase
MAPEQVRGQCVDARTDIYALGVLLYQAVTGEAPFVAETAFSMALMHVHAPPRAPRHLNPTIPAALEQVILRAMAKDPAERFQTAEDMVAALRKALAVDNAAAGGRAPDAVSAASNHPTTLLALAEPTPTRAESRLVRVAAGPRPHRRSFILTLIMLLLLGFASGGVVFAFPNLVNRDVPSLVGIAPWPTQIYVSKGTFTIQDQQIIVPSGRDVEEAYSEAFVLLARQDPRFGPYVDINPNAPPTFIGQARKIRDEPRGIVYQATMTGVVFVPQE